MNFGDIVQLNCLVSKGDRPIKISWLFNEEPLKEDLSVSKTAIGDRTSLLMISPVLGSHAGNYTCVAGNAAGSVAHTASLRVNGTLQLQHVPCPIASSSIPDSNPSLRLLVLPQILPFDFGHRPMSSGEAAQVTCLVSTGDRPLNITWKFRNREASSFPGVTVTEVGQKASLLIIDPVSSMHAGNYTCSARNVAGTASYQATLRINGNRRRLRRGGNLPNISFLSCPL